MSKTIDTDLGQYVIYHVSEAGSPSAHDIDNGEWFFQPADVNDGEVFSGAYKTEAEAEAAALEWVAGEINEQNAAR